MSYAFLATWELNVCAKFQVRSSKTVAATLRTYIHTDRKMSKVMENSWVHLENLNLNKKCQSKQN